MPPIPASPPPPDVPLTGAALASTSAGLSMESSTGHSGTETLNWSRGVLRKALGGLHTVTGEALWLFQHFGESRFVPTKESIWQYRCPCGTSIIISACKDVKSTSRLLGTSRVIVVRSIVSLRERDVAIRWLHRRQGGNSCTPTRRAEGTGCRRCRCRC